MSLKYFEKVKVKAKETENLVLRYFCSVQTLVAAMNVENDTKERFTFSIGQQL